MVVAEAAIAAAEEPLELAEVTGLADDVSKALAALAMLPNTFCEVGDDVSSGGGGSNGRLMVVVVVVVVEEVVV